MAYSLDILKASGIRVKKRPEWGNRYPYSSYSFSYPGRYLFMHITVTRQTGTLNERTRVVEQIGASRFPNTRFSYIAVVHRGGEIHEGQPRGRKGAHTVNNKGISGFPYDLNAYGEALSYVGMEADPFGEAEIEASARWFAAKVLSGESRATDIYPHNYFAYKACPGAKVMTALPEIRRRFKRYVAAGRLPGGTVTTTGGTDVQLTDKINLITGQGVQYSTTSTTVGGILASTNFYVLTVRNMVGALTAQVTKNHASVSTALTAMAQALAAATADPDIDEQAIADIVAAAVREQVGDTFADDVVQAMGESLVRPPVA